MHSYSKDQELNKENTTASQNAINNSSAADCSDFHAHPPFIPLAVLCFTEEAFQREALTPS
jgi:hypothetical protein